MMYFIIKYKDIILLITPLINQKRLLVLGYCQTHED